VIQSNEIRGNIIGIELEKAKDTQIEQNMLNNLITDLDEK
jgi:parallel beta-helix repeat protein